ncbi:MAG: molybdopterin cofactor-binding domain-containing protein, partial [Pseudomonadales bacterium]
MTPSAQFSRRSFLQGSLGALTLAVTSKGLITTAWAADSNAKQYGADSMPGGTVEDPLVFVSIAADGTVTIVAHRAEMGTGVRTSLPMVVADEMEARWDRVKVVQAEADEARYGNQNVDGSRSVRHFLMPMRRVGAAARQMLEAAAAARWSVPVAQVKAVQHEVLHQPTGRRLTYGDLAADAAKQPVPTSDALKLKDRAEFRYIGKDQVRLVDLEAIGKGQATYGMDMRLPGMVYAVVARPPVVGGKLRRFNSAKALSVPGVLKLVEIPAMKGAPAFQPLGGVAVVARNTWAARQGRDALEIEWDDGPNGHYDSTSYRQTLETAARQPGKSIRNEGDTTQAWAQAPEGARLAAEYYVPHLAHASMEPPVATVRINGKTAEVWTSIQNPVAARDAV